MHLFSENLAHMGFSIVLLRKQAISIDGELFTASRLHDAA
jgi:hypothetical protein